MEALVLQWDLQRVRQFADDAAAEQQHVRELARSTFHLIGDRSGDIAEGPSCADFVAEVGDQRSEAAEAIS